MTGTSTAAPAHLRVHRGGDVVLVELDRPRVHNACDTRTHRELQAVVRSLDGVGGQNVRALVLAGRGPSFCAGSDVRHTGSLDADGLRRYVALDAATKDALASCPVPTVAWVHGHALGGGFELALACDFRAVTEDADIGLPEASLGTLPGAGGIQRLAELAGTALAREVVLLGRRLTGTEAHRLGLATWLVTGQATLAAARALLAPLLRLDPLVVRLARAALAPAPAVSPIEHAFHELAAAASHGTGTFDHKTAPWRGEGR